MQKCNAKSKLDIKFVFPITRMHLILLRVLEIIEVHLKTIKYFISEYPYASEILMNPFKEA